MDDALKPTAGPDSAEEVEAADEADVETAAEAQSTRQSPRRDGKVLWFGHHGMEFAVREGTPEHEKLERALARPMRSPTKAEPADKKPSKPVVRSTKATRG